jgi:hypothetical protein
VTYRWKDFNNGYNFDLDLVAIRYLHTKLWAPKAVKVLVMGIMGFTLGSFETKCHLDVAPMERRK